MSDLAVVVAGDCGFGFTSINGDKEALSKLRKYCMENNVMVYFLRGNHDDPSYFSEGKLTYDCFVCLPDYSVLTIGDKSGELNVLCIGGGTSIDRKYRIEKYNERLKDYMRYHFCDITTAEHNVYKGYWEDEQPYYDEEALTELLEQGIQIDFVVTHTCPSFCEPLTKDGIKGWMERDETLEHDVDQERVVMDKVYNRLMADKHPLKKWIYGHFHYHNYNRLNDIDWVLLDMSISGTCDLYEIYRNEKE